MKKQKKLTKTMPIDAILPEFKTYRRAIDRHVIMCGNIEQQVFMLRHVTGHNERYTSDYRIVSG